MVEISGLEAKGSLYGLKGEIERLENLTPKGVFIGFLLGLSDLSPS